jgi:hypothetical protein
MEYYYLDSTPGPTVHVAIGTYNSLAATGNGPR